MENKTPYETLLGELERNPRPATPIDPRPYITFSVFLDQARVASGRITRAGEKAFDLSVIPQPAWRADRGATGLPRCQSDFYDAGSDPAGEFLKKLTKMVAQVCVTYIGENADRLSFEVYPNFPRSST